MNDLLPANYAYGCYQARGNRLPWGDWRRRSVIGVGEPKTHGLIKPLIETGKSESARKGRYPRPVRERKEDASRGDKHPGRYRQHLVSNQQKQTTLRLAHYTEQGSKYLTLSRRLLAPLLATAGMSMRRQSVARPPSAGIP